ncbi:recombinase family protein [Paramaledivibacter caminithermalis]|jgi:DNA invertase Pin-like site-specific DNA recombinase|uniref:Site-specific DNA recombinase n=1 Tax=Paramaledivibacter caminithermalis (strain DSM 15212 / CIP 107654 / DViRD3) TaxID=1121301 RepID=A0A1M6K6F5_PARC5|nr:recombinase family protein [Paramaledivibacter caminithermalis]SHJ54515.1 Site-specific DNA recombinase [Paramaledivibacter caminithermalis DSM 15212]
MFDDIDVKYKDFKVGIYCRLSREDEGDYQSESIKNQKDYLIKYVLEKEWTIADIYIDDGYTGTNFDRPDFQRLINDIEKGKINLVITKDLSRLGRDYISTGYYLEKYFPENNVRYIAVNDAIDTYKNSAGNDISPFKSVINDMYAKDISVKVRSTLDTKRKKGKFIGAFAPFGYRKSKDDKNKLEIDEETAPIVRRIFHLYLNGCGISKIAHILNDEGVICPTQYKQRTTNYKGTVIKSLWNHNTVRTILKNPTYMGCLAQNKYKKVNYKSKKLRTLSDKEWIIVEDTHEPIVNKKIFLDVQEMMKRKYNKEYKGRKSNRLFSGFVYCGDCKAYMTYTKTSSELYLICSTYKRYTSKYCSRHGIKEKDLKQLIIEDIKALSEYVNSNKLVKAANEETKFDLRKEFNNQIQKLDNRIRELKTIINTLYTDKVKGLINEEEFLEMKKDFSIEKEKLQNRYDNIKMRLNEYEKDKKESERISNIVNKIMNMEELDRYALEQLVDKIEIFEDKKIKIHYNFINPIN